MSSLFQAIEVSRSPDEACFRLHGALFFGAVAKIDPILSVAEGTPCALCPVPCALCPVPCALRIRLDLQSLQPLGTVGLAVPAQLPKALKTRSGRLVLIGAKPQPQPRNFMARSGFLKILD